MDLMDCTTRLMGATYLAHAYMWCTLDVGRATTLLLCRQNKKTTQRWCATCAMTTRVRLQQLVAIPRICLVASTNPRRDRKMEEAKTESGTVRQSELFEKEPHRLEEAPAGGGGFTSHRAQHSIQMFFNVFNCRNIFTTLLLFTLWDTSE